MSAAKAKCPVCKQPIDLDSDVAVVCVSDTATELKADCLECFAVFSCWIDHKVGWSDEDGNPVDMTVKKGGAL